MTDQENMKAAVPDAARRYMRYLLIMAGLGGLLYGVDVGVIAAEVIVSQHDIAGRLCYVRTLKFHRNAHGCFL